MQVGQSSRILVLSRPEDCDALIRVLQSSGKSVTLAFGSCDNYNPNEFDAALCFCYGPIIKESVLNRWPQGIVNLHPSFLPWGRGIYPILWAAYEMRPFGYTFFKIDRGIDTGPILLRTRVEPRPNETLRSLHARLIGRLIADTPRVLAGLSENSLEVLPQGALEPGVYRNRAQGTELLKRYGWSWDTSISEVMERGRLDGRLHAEPQLTSTDYVPIDRKLP